MSSLNQNLYFQEKTGKPVISVLKDEELHQMENMAKRLTTLAKVKKNFFHLIYFRLALLNACTCKRHCTEMSTYLYLLDKCLFLIR